jgi:predicted alpha/beta hydrolase family esterase
VLVAHSLGAVAAVQLLSRWPQLRVGGALLVAPAEPSRDARTAPFGKIPEGALHVPTIVAASRNDPWMDQPRARWLAKRWGAEFVDMGEAGHVNLASGFGPWPEGRALRDLIWSLPAMPGRATAGPQDRLTRKEAIA